MNTVNTKQLASVAQSQSAPTIRYHGAEAVGGATAFFIRMSSHRVHRRARRERRGPSVSSVFSVAKTLHAFENRCSMAPSSQCSLSIPFIFLIILRRKFEVIVFGGLYGPES